jgi:hypothetical protein
MYHYSFVFPKQVWEKAQYYRNAAWSKRTEAEWWANDVFLKLTHPYKVFSISWVPSWLIKFKKAHPKVILQLIEDINSGNIKVDLRKTKDIEKLVNSLWYRIGIVFLKFLEPTDRIYHRLKTNLKHLIKKFLFRIK